jgi:hypothetical protein
MYGCPTLLIRKLAASVTESMLPIFIMSWTICWSWLCRDLCTHPGRRFALYLSSLVPFLPKYRPTKGAMIVHGWPKYLAVVIWKQSFS